LVKLGVHNRGCLGLSYSVGFTNLHEKKPLDEIIEQNGIKFLIEPTSFIYLLGTQIDFDEDELSSKFTFNNSNAVSHF
jgi:iron-sulfur cluster assembly protein